MRLAAKVDLNHREIVDGLRAVGYSVLDLAGVGRGCPDVLVSGRNASNVLLEIKSDKGTLTPQQERFHLTWPGEKYVVYSLPQALSLLSGGVDPWLPR